MSSEIAGVLSRAADLIEPAGAWIQGANARDSSGERVLTTNPDAVRFCANGAARHVAGSILPWNRVAEVVSFVDDALSSRGVFLSVSDWNDRSERTQAEAVQLLRDAAKLAEQEATDAR